HLHGELAAQQRIGVGQCVLQRAVGAVLAGGFHLLDGQVAGVEHQRVRLRVDPVQRVRGGAGDLLRTKVDGQVQRQVGGADLAGLGIGELIVGGIGGHGGLGGGGGGSGGVVGGCGLAGTAGGGEGGDGGKQ